MKYHWTKNPPTKGIPGVATERANVWPKPTNLKYANIDGDYVAIGKLKTGRWEIYIWQIVETRPSRKNILGQIKYKWVAKSKKKGDHKPGYSNYQNAYRSIPQHLKGD